MINRIVPKLLKIGRFGALSPQSAPDNGASLLSNILALMSGSVAARIISVLVIPVLTRMYTPDDFGIVGLFIATVALTAPLATFRYEVAIPLPVGDKASLAVAALAMGMMLGMMALLSIALFLGGRALFSSLGIEELFQYSGLLLLAVVATSLFDVFQYWALRKKHMARMARTQVLQSLASSAAKVSLGFTGIGALGLVVGQIVQQAVGVVSLGRQFLMDAASLLPTLRWRQVCAVARRYRAFPLLRLPSQLLQVAAIKLPLVFSAMLFGTATTGQLSLAFSALAIPVTLVSQTVGNAFYAEIAALGAGEVEQIRLLTLKVMRTLALIAAAPVAFVVLAGPWLFSIAFGEAWIVAGEIARMLSLFLFIQLVTAPVIHVLTVFRRDRDFLQISVVRAGLVVAAFAIAKGMQFGVVETVAVYTGAMMAHYVLVAIRVVRSLKPQAQS